MAEEQWVILYDFDNLKADPTVVTEAIRERGRIVFARAYGDAMRDQKYREVFLEANVEIIDRPRLNKADHRGNDIRMAIDAVEFALRHPNVTHFALVTGDTDFIPLVNRLKLYGMYVTIVGSRRNTSPKIIQACDTYLCYEDLVREEVLTSDDFQSDALALYRKAVDALREQGGPTSPARVQRMLARIDPSFRWRDGGFLEFSEFLTWVKGQLDREESVAVDEPGELNGKEIHAFNLLLRALDKLREDDVAATPIHVREQMVGLDPSFDEALMGFASFAAFLDRMGEAGNVVHGKTFVRLEPEFGWRRGLKRLQITPQPALLDAFLKAFETRTVEAEAAEERPTLGEMASRVKKAVKASNQKVNDLVRAVKFSGAVLPLEGEGYVTFHLPYRLVASGDDLKRRVLKGYLRKLARVQSFKRTDLALFASMLQGDDREEHQQLLHDLAREMVKEGLLKATKTTFSYVKRGTPEPESDA